MLHLRLLRLLILLASTFFSLQVRPIEIRIGQKIVDVTSRELPGELHFNFSSSLKKRFIPLSVCSRVFFFFSRHIPQVKYVLQEKRKKKKKRAPLLSSRHYCTRHWRLFFFSLISFLQEQTSLHLYNLLPTSFAVQTMHRTYSMRQSRVPTASQVESPPPPLSTTKTGRWLGKGGIGESD